LGKTILDNAFHRSKILFLAGAGSNSLLGKPSGFKIARASWDFRGLLFGELSPRHGLASFCFSCDLDRKSTNASMHARLSTQEQMA
jgi:hypothetical protein